MTDAVRIYEQLREPGSAATVHTLMAPSFRGLDGLGAKQPRSHLKEVPPIEKLGIVENVVREAPIQPPTFRLKHVAGQQSPH